ncbi:class I SAM-dependent methyltransferase [Sphingosinicella microcystinivorans]|uniref:Methyltransferase family protein n=1 Tax=Sphingosinicella microcystinivorans TaxID=335406 RepID=A0AAD1D569_SPHMI|nr:class I SAM-dependent methyltransferase [Sphingosinicella microcystinivorans]RKS90605.1 methyltransferase family protein [Sphingosinicella microcystinivorans]BBE33519.1 methyltransferase type 11 [Sphingosinicella microcystinivorans]
MTAENQRVGRHIFGSDAAGYASARPQYPESLYVALAAEALTPGADVFEIGPGTGQASRRLIAADIASLTLIEPDPVLAARLADLGNNVRVVNAPLEEAGLPQSAFDLGVAATSFHWVDSARGLPMVRDLLRPGGVWAMWWNVLHDPEQDLFSRAVLPLLKDAELPPSLRGPEQRHYSLWTDDRLAELSAAGFAHVEHQMHELTVRMTAAEMRALYATFSMIRRMAPELRARMLAGIEAVGEQGFGGVIERRFRVPLFIARKAR